MDVVAHYAWFGAGLLLMTALTVGLGWWAGTGLRLFPLWAILRAVVQLSVIALLLRGILTVPWTVAGFVLLMLTTASLTAIGRIHELWHGRFAAVAGVLAGALIALVVIFGLRLVDFQVRYLVATSCGPPAPARTRSRRGSRSARPRPARTRTSAASRCASR